MEPEKDYNRNFSAVKKHYIENRNSFEIGMYVVPDVIDIFWETFEANPIIAQKFRDVSKTSPNHNAGEPFPFMLTYPVEELMPNYFPTSYSYLSILRFFNVFDGP